MALYRSILPAALVVFSAGLPAGAGDPTAKAAWEDLFADGGSRGEAGRIDAVLTACGADPAKLRALIRSDAAYRPFKGGWTRRATKVADGKTGYTVEFFVRIPNRYAGRRPRAVMLAAHGQNGNGRSMAMMMQWMLGASADEYIIVAPTMPGPRRYYGKAYQEQAYLKPLAWARANLNVDDDRIFVSGYSMGGHEAWHFAALWPHLFAGAVPMAGVPTFQGSPYTNHSYLSNLAHLRVWAVWGELDRRTPGTLGNVDFCRMAAKRLATLGNGNFKGTELAGVGHGGCWPTAHAFRRFLAAGKRVTTPQRLSHMFHSRRHGQGYYLLASELSRPEVDFDRRPRIKLDGPIGRTPSAEDVIRAGRKHYDRQLFKLFGELDRAANRLTVRSVGVRSVRVQILEGMFDLAKPVTLCFAGRAWTGRVAASARCMLTHYAAARDATRIVLNEVTLTPSGKAVVRWK